MTHNPFINGTHIMGIVNVTPDSFSDGGDHDTTDAAVHHAKQLVTQGADIIDIGGESTRPGANPVSIDEELSRVLPVIKQLKGNAQWISIDTRHAVVMEAAIRAGANFINDVSALEDDANSLSIAAKYDVPICLMHKKGLPKTMQDNVRYDDVVEEVYAYLENRIQLCMSSGIAKDRLVVDPGIGFGKNRDHNLALIKSIDRFHALNVPVLLGASRKSFIEHVMGTETRPKDRLGGSLAVALYALQKNVQIVRVHDVLETRQALQVTRAVESVSS